MIDVSIKLRDTPHGFTLAHAMVMGSDIERPAVWTGVLPTEGEALAEAWAFVMAEVEDGVA